MSTLQNTSRCIRICSCERHCHPRYGPTGPTGPTGPNGLMGPIGPRGPMGQTGPTGSAGLMGPIGPTGPNGIEGRIGPMGPTGPIGPTGPFGLDGRIGPMGPTGPQGIQGIQGIPGQDGGPTGPTGPAGGTDGPTGPTGPGMNTMFSFTTSESVNSGDFIGCGNSSSSLLRNTIVVPYTCETHYLMLHVRNFSDKVQYTATLWINDSPSSLVVVIPAGVSVKCVIGYGNIQLNSCDLITVQITYPNGAGALADGVCASLVVKPK